MTVKELIDELLKLDQNLEVRVPLDSFYERITSSIDGAEIRIKTENDADDESEIGKEFILIA